MRYDKIELLMIQPMVIRVEQSAGQCPHCGQSYVAPVPVGREQAIRMSTVFRKVTNGFRSEWGRDLFAAVRSVVNTGNAMA
jgi:hypothetical protein